MQIRTLSKPLEEKAREELNEDPTKIGEKVGQLRTWLVNQINLPQNIDDQTLLNFLRGSKYKLDRTKERLHAYHTFKTLAPDIAQNLDPLLTTIQDFLKLGVCVRLPLPVDNLAAPTTVLLRYGKDDPNDVTLTTMLKATVMMVDMLIKEDDNFSISGINVIWDMKGIQYKTSIQATPNLLRNCIYFHGKAYPARLRAVHVLNAPKFAVKFINVFKNFFPKKIADRFYFYSEKNWKTLFEHIPKSIFPNEYGGNAGPLDTIAVEWKKIVESNRKKLIQQNNDSANTFAKLEIDRLDCNLKLDGLFRNLDID